MGTAAMQGALWSAKATDWADAQEQTVRPVFEAVIAELGVKQGTALLDVGCGAGMFCELAAARGACVSGFDAAEAFIAIARARVPGADFRVGDMEDLPFRDDSFDLVTGFNSFQYAANPVAALREAKRVARVGGTVVAMVWGRQEDCEAAVYLKAVGSLLPPPPPGAPGPFALSQDGALESLMKEAGLNPKGAFDVNTPWQYPNLETALRGMLSAGPAVRAIRHSGET
ncbi:MAG: class I SAM-dependent methyltransferase, partial [Gammaproteobacteria bacterium]